MIVKVKGVIEKALERKSGVSSSGKSWASQEFVIKEDNERQTILCFEVFGEETLAELNLQVGKNVELSCVIECREWNGKYYTKLKALPPKNAQTTTTTQTAVNTPKTENNNSNDNLPF